jgi:hypothetical protein
MEPIAYFLVRSPSSEIECGSTVDFTRPIRSKAFNFSGNNSINSCAVRLSFIVAYIIVFPAVILILLGTVEASLLVVFEIPGAFWGVADTSEGGLAGCILFGGVFAKPQTACKAISPSTSMNAVAFLMALIP